MKILPPSPTLLETKSFPSGELATVVKFFPSGWTKKEQ
jgi:hypothetical protein